MIPESIRRFLTEKFSAIEEHTPYTDTLLDEYLRLGALHQFIPVELGGRFKSATELMEFVEFTSYSSLPLGLSLGIAGSLFLRPIVLHARPELRDPILEKFLTSPALGGLMLTEPTGGTDVGAFQTHYSQEGDTLSISGSKCWGGLTGKADHWLVAARLKRAERLTNRMALVYVPLSSSGISVDRSFDALGLRPIPYGETRYNGTRVPAINICARPGESPLRAIYDTLYRSRLGLPAISVGICRRLSEEAQARAECRTVAGKPLSEYDQIQYKLLDLRGIHELTHCLGLFTGAWMDSHEDVSNVGVLANCSKVICTETMHLSSDSSLQLFASAAYKRNHLVGRAYVDSRAFRIFEGVNEVLDESSYDIISGGNGGCDRNGVEAVLTAYGLSPRGSAVEPALQALDVPQRAQREKVAAGRMIAWLIALGTAGCAPNKSEEQRHAASLFASRKLAESTAALSYLF